MPSTDLAGEWYLGPHIGYIFIGDDDDFRCDCDLDQDDYIKFGGRLGYFLTNHFALEATANYMNLHPDYWELTLGGLYDFTPRYPGWNTYLGFGGGVAGEDPFSDAVPIAYLALGSEYRFSKLVGLRLEARGNYSFETDLEDEFGEFTQDSRFDFEPTIGLLFHFGGRAAPTVIVPGSGCLRRRPSLRPRRRRPRRLPRRCRLRLRRSLRRRRRRLRRRTRSTSTGAARASRTSPRRAWTPSRCGCARTRARPS